MLNVFISNTDRYTQRIITMKYFVASTILALIHCIDYCAYGFPLKKNTSYKQVIPNDEQFKFMQRYGYLGGDLMSGTAAQYTEESIIKAIANIQKYGGIEPTGILDNRTIALMKKPRCGVKDILANRRHKRYTLAGRGWQKREITYTIDNWNPYLGEQSVRDAVKKALDMWAPYGKLTFVPSNNPSSDIKISFGVGDHGDQYPFDGRGAVLAHAFFPYVRYGGSVHFDNDENWLLNKTDEDEGTDFFAVAVHELGHALGLAHSTVPESIMFAYYKGGPMQLDYDDVMAMYQLYISRSINNEIPERNDDTTENDKTEEYSPVTEVSTIREVEDAEIFTTTDYYYTTTTAQPKIFTEKTINITYNGDYETVEDHKKHDDKHRIPGDHHNTSELCSGEYDTVAVLRRELFVFKGQKVWRFKSKGVLYEGFPTNLSTVFPNLPSYIQRIDAAYENMQGYITFFSGSSYWIYDNHVRGPYNLEDYRISDQSSINAILLWPKNERTYLFGKDKFWRFNERTNSLDEGYPKDMNRWHGIPNDVNAVINWIDDNTYFFKGFFFWRFDNQLIEADRHYPLPVPQRWFGCPETAQVFQELRRFRSKKRF